ncbi:protein of unknown function [Paraburkholderia kururiensis]
MSHPSARQLCALQQMQLRTEDQLGYQN